MIYNLIRSGCYNYKNQINSFLIGFPLSIEIAQCKNKISGVVDKIFNNKIANFILYRNGLKNRNFDAELATIARGQGASEHTNFEAKPMLPKTDSLGYFGIAVGTFAIMNAVPITYSATLSIGLFYIAQKIILNRKAYQQNLKNNPGFYVIMGVIGSLALAIFGMYVAIPFATRGFSWNINLPFQTGEVVLLEYCMLAILHGAIAYSKYKKENSHSYFHLFAAAMACLLGIFYFKTDQRLHHSFYGLILMAAPFRSLQFLGSAITLDSACYLIQPMRGYFDANSNFHDYDIINTILEKPSYYAAGYTAALIGEDCHSISPVPDQ